MISVKIDHYKQKNKKKGGYKTMQTITIQANPSFLNQLLHVAETMAKAQNEPLKVARGYQDLETLDDEVIKADIESIVTAIDKGEEKLLSETEYQAEINTFFKSL